MPNKIYLLIFSSWRKYETKWRTKMQQERKKNRNISDWIYIVSWVQAHETNGSTIIRNLNVPMWSQCSRCKSDRINKCLYIWMNCNNAMQNDYMYLYVFSRRTVLMVFLPCWLTFIMYSYSIEPFLESSQYERIICCYVYNENLTMIF